MTLTVRRSPCGSCPYRRDVPSGIWAAANYLMLPRYDGEAVQQAAAGAYAVFMCHQGTEQLCAGWAGHREDPNDLLALRFSVAMAETDPAALRYSTRVPLFASGAEAAEHGLRDIDRPGPEARAAIAKIARLRALRGRPLRASSLGALFHSEGTEAVGER